MLNLLAIINIQIQLDFVYLAYMHYISIVMIPSKKQNNKYLIRFYKTNLK